MEITCRIYKPSRARESPLFRLVEQHLEELLRVWPVRFARQHDPLRPVVERVLRGPLKVVAYITDSLAIRQILDHLDLSPPEKPPPETRDVVRAPLDDERREIELQPT